MFEVVNYVVKGESCQIACHRLQVQVFGTRGRIHNFVVPRFLDPMNRTFGYSRVSTSKQHLDAQTELLQSAGRDELSLKSDREPTVNDLNFKSCYLYFAKGIPFSWLSWIACPILARYAFHRWGNRVERSASPSVAGSSDRHHRSKR